MNLAEINTTIEELEQGNTTFDACMKLASLYTVREHLQHDTVIKEYNDILPSYDNYVDCKTQYQLGYISETKVASSLEMLCTEIYEFIYTLHRCINTECEGEQIQALVDRINSI